MNSRTFPMDLPTLVDETETFEESAWSARLSVAEGRLAQGRPIWGNTIHGVLCRDPKAAMEMLLALWRAGFAAAPLPWRHPPHTLRRGMERLGSRILWVGNAPEEQVQGDSFSTVSIRDLFDRDAKPLRALSDPMVPSQDRPPGDLYLFTSGSTGEPKIAVHRLASLVANAEVSLHNMPLQATDGWYLNLPLFHVGGISILVRTALAGARVVLPSSTGPYTHLSVVAAQLAKAAEDAAERSRLARLKAVLLGGGPVPESLASRMVSMGVPLHVTYGLTEMASQVATSPWKEGDTGPRGARVLPGHEVALARDGEILVKGPSLFVGYHTARGLDPARDEQGFFHTGDLGTLVHGRLQVTGRRDNLMISGGENIQPEEIEGILKRHPAVAEAVVLPIPHPRWGTRPVAFIEWRDGVSAPHEDGLRAFLADHLPKYKIPDQFRNWPFVPESRTPNGKPNRFYLKGLLSKESSTL